MTSTHLADTPVMVCSKVQIRPWLQAPHMSMKQSLSLSKTLHGVKREDGQKNMYKQKMCK